MFSFVQIVKLAHPQATHCQFQTCWPLPKPECTKPAHFFHFPPAQKSLTGETMNEGPDGWLSASPQMVEDHEKSFLGDLTATTPRSRSAPSICQNLAADMRMWRHGAQHL